MARICPLFSGSSGNCYYVGSATAGILIDAGRSAKQIEAKLKQWEIPMHVIQAVFVTHEHTDHVKGLRVLTAKYGIPVFSSLGTLQALERLELLPSDIAINLVEERGIECAGMWISTFEIQHDCAQGVGFHITTADDRTLAFATDLGCMTEQVRKNLLGSDFVVLESNHEEGMLRTGNYPYYLKRRILSDRGHLSNVACAEMLPELAQSGTARFLLAHLSHENNTPEIALQTALCALQMKGLKKGRDYEISVAQRENENLGIILF